MVGHSVYDAYGASGLSKLIAHKRKEYFFNRRLYQW